MRLSSRSLNGMGQGTITRFRCSQMTLRLDQFALVLIFDERPLRPDWISERACSKRTNHFASLAVSFVPIATKGSAPRLGLPPLHFHFPPTPPLRYKHP